jgi:hypothetical protein
LRINRCHLENIRNNTLRAGVVSLLAKNGIAFPQKKNYTRNLRNSRTELGRMLPNLQSTVMICLDYFPPETSSEQPAGNDLFLPRPAKHPLNVSARF